MPTVGQWVSLGGNAITLVTALGVLARIAWKKFTAEVRNNVTAPLTQLQSSVDTLTIDLNAVRDDAKRANDRLDRHLESHGS